MLRKFWMIIRADESTGENVTHQHYDFLEAEKEAERLCRKEGKPFYVLEMIGRVEPGLPFPPVSWERTGNNFPYVKEK
jgi:hypothetical protein